MEIKTRQFFSQQWWRYERFLYSFQKHLQCEGGWVKSSNLHLCEIDVGKTQSILRCISLTSGLFIHAHFIYLLIFWYNHINVSGELGFCLALPKTTGNTSLMMLLDSLQWYRGRSRAWACNEDGLSSKSSRVPGMEMSVAETWQWWWYRSRFKQMKISHPTKNSASLRIAVGRRGLISGQRVRSI